MASPCAIGRSYSVRIASLQMRWSGLALAAPGDVDDDGVPDPFDNCLEACNPDQRHEYRDGFGAVCDPDFENDGDVVHRGELLGSMGTTFNSSGPRLHFASKKKLGNGHTIVARFEVRDPTSADPGAPNTPLAICYEPRNCPAADSPHRYLYSTNQP